MTALLGLVLSALNVAAAAWVGMHYGWINPGGTMLWAAGGTFVLVTIKALVAMLIGKSFSWAGQAHDACVMALGACMPAFVISMAAKQADDLPVWAAYTAFALLSTLATGRLYQVATAITAPRFRDWLVISAGLVLGMLNFGLYTLLAIEKVQKATG